MKHRNLHDSPEEQIAVRPHFSESEFTAAHEGHRTSSQREMQGGLFGGTGGCEGDSLPPVSRLKEHTHTHQYKRDTIHPQSNNFFLRVSKSGKSHCCISLRFTPYMLLYKSTLS